MHRLKSFRLEKGMSLAAVAVRARMGIGTLIMVEKYGYIPTLKTQVKISNALGVSVGKIWPSGDRPDSPTAA